MKTILHRMPVTLAAMAILFGSASCTSVQSVNTPGRPKYVFFFLGDGLSSTQIQAAEAFKTGDEHSAETLLADAGRLHMTRLSTSGYATTFSDTRFITDSAAAVTAFACGIKTGPGVLGRNTALDTSYRSIAELAQEQGRAIGIVSSVSLSHATPAGYYANVNSRNQYCEIGYQAALSGFDFFGGGLFPKLDSSKNAGNVELGKAFTDAGYTTLRDKNEILPLKDKARGKVICSVATSYDGDAMPFAIDHPEENFTLTEITQTAINYLAADPEGFFIMVEGGKIDWAGHANDIATSVREVLAFDEAIGAAVAFMKKHPEETLIVVTSDHETGGLTLGFRGTRYQTRLDALRGQNTSGVRFIKKELAAYRQANPWKSPEESNIDETMKTLIKSCFGLDWNALSDYQREKLESAYDASLGAVKADDRPSGYDPEGISDVDYLGYGGTDPLTVTLTRMVANKAGLEWASSSHTAVPVPVFASGAGADLFDGSYDNTDIPRKLAVIMGIPPLPTVDTERSGPSPF